MRRRGTRIVVLSATKEPHVRFLRRDRDDATALPG
jgi:hypothetical protein